MKNPNQERLGILMRQYHRHHPISVKRLSWCTGVDLCIPVDVRTEEEICALAGLAKRLLKGETNLTSEFSGYEYGRAEWLAEDMLRSQSRDFGKAQS